MPNYLKLAAETALSVFGIRSHYEQPRYKVLEYLGSVEVRAYEKRLVAEATVTAADEAAGREQAFRILAAYIFGQNRDEGAVGAGKTGRPEAATAAPETTRSEPAGASREIAMTTPVETARASDGRYAMRFVLPRELTLATAPQPLDARVRLLEIPAETIAALPFTGRGTPAELARRKGDLLSALKSSAWRPAGEPATLFYDPPFTLPFLRRNEVVVAVEPTRRASAAADA